MKSNWFSWHLCKKVYCTPLVWIFAKKKVKNVTTMVIYYLFNLKVVNKMAMSRFWVWLSHPYNVIAIFELCLSPLCFIFVIQVLVHQLHLQGCFLVVCIVSCCFPWNFVPTFLLCLFCATSFSSSIVGWNS